MTNLQHAEATGTSTTLEFRGHTYELDLMRMSWDTLDADRTGDFTTMVRDMLGDEQFATFKERNPRPLEVNGDGELVNVAVEMRTAILAALGNLNASSSS